MNRPQCTAIALLLLAACSSSSAPQSATTTTTTATTTTTTAAVPSSTTTTALLPALPAAQPGGDVRALVSPTGVVVAVLGGSEGEGWRVLTPCGEETVVDGGAPLTGATVVLDPGHGGEEPGAVGPNGLAEKDLNLAVAERTEALLQDAGATVVLTRTGDYRITLEARALIATNLGALAFVSVHHNAAPDGPVDRPGTETYFQIASPDSRRLAGLLYEEVVSRLGTYPGVAWQADTDAGAKYRPSSSGGDYYGILRRSAGVPAVLTEALFLSNPPEAELLARPEVQQAEAEALARGIARYLTSEDPGSGFIEPYPRTEPAGPGGGNEGCEDPPLE